MKRFESVPLEAIAVSLRINTRQGCRNIIRDSFEYAKKYGYKTVTVVEKPNVVRETSGLMVREARKIAAEYPGIELWEANIDAMCMWLIKNPQDSGCWSPAILRDIFRSLAQLSAGWASPSGNSA